MLKHIMIFFTAFLFISAFFMRTENNVIATGVDVTLTDWDDESAGSQSGISGEIEYEQVTSKGTDYWGVSTSWSVSGTKSFRYGFLDATADPVQGWWNLTSEYDYIKSFSFYLRCPTMSAGGTEPVIQFFNNGTKVMEFIFENSVANGRFSYYDIGTGDYEVIETNFFLLPQDAFKLTVTHNNTNSMIYRLYNITGSIEDTVEGGSAVGTEWTTFDSIYFDSGLVSVGEYGHFFIDDFKIHLEAETGQYGDVSGYDYIGSTSCDDYFYSSYGVDYLETKWIGTLENTIIRALDLTIDGSDQTTGNYRCWINGNSIGQADYIFQQGEHYIARWIGFASPIDNEQIVAEFRHYDSEETGLAYRWVFGGSIYTDLNGDNWRGYYLHDKANNINGQFDSLSAGYDPCWKFYFDAESWTPSPPATDWTDDLEFSGEGYLGKSPYDNSIEAYYQYSNVYITWGVSNILLNNYMWIYDDDGNPVGQTQQVYYGESFSPLKLLEGAYDGTVSFVPYNTGNYTVNIVRNGVIVANKTFYVYENTNDYFLYTIPNPSYQTDSYTCYYKYTNDEKDGYLCVFDVYETDVQWGNELDKWYIGNGTVTGNVQHYPQQLARNGYVWVIYVQVSNTIYTPVYQHNHFVRQDQYTDNTLSAYYDVVNLNNNQVISFYHNYVGSEIYLFINGVQTLNIGNRQNGDITYLCDQTGSYNASMKINMNSTWYLLAWDTWQVTTTTGEETEAPILPTLTQPLGSIVGLIIVFGALIAPFLVAGKISNGAIQVPIFAYIISGGTGIAVATMMGCFPAWIPFFIVALGIISIVGAFVIKKQSDGGI